MSGLFGFKLGAIAFGLAFLTAGAFTFVFKLVYQWVTPYRERDLIAAGNLAAAISLSGALLGYVIPLTSALAHTDSLLEFAAWAALAGVIQIVTFVAVRWLAMRDVAARIAANDLAAGVYLASISLVVGALNAACMTA